MSLLGQFKKKYFYLQELETLKYIIIEGRRLRGGSDQEIWIMWLGLEIVVAGLHITS